VHYANPLIISQTVEAVVGQAEPQGSAESPPLVPSERDFRIGHQP